MAWVFNPFTGKLDFAGGGGGGSSYIDGEVQYYADLPIVVGTPAIDSAFLVREGSGTWLINRHPAGIYIRLGNTGALTDWTYAGTFPDVFSDANFTIYNDANSSKEVQFDASLISNATTRTLTIPNASGTIALAENVVAKAGDTMTGKLILPASTTTSAPLNIPHGVDPTSFTNGDIWLNGSIRYRDQAGNLRFVADLNRPNTFTQRQTISADSFTDLPALKITQLGSGEALRVEDESPESTPFVVSASGRVGIGVTPDTTVALKVDSTGIKFNDNTVFTTATPSFPDNTFEIKDNTDPTRKVAFECSGISAATTRTLTIPNASGTIQLAQEVRSDFVTDTSYIGLAPFGSAESANVWTIYRNIIDSEGNITSTTTATNVAWDDRLTATYT